MERRNSNKHILWLVRSGDRILGPFTRDEVVHKLNSVELVVLDEVSLPHSRWRHIREEPQFARVVEDLRKASFGSGDGPTSITQTRSNTWEGNVAGGSFRDQLARRFESSRSQAIQEGELVEEHTFEKPRGGESGYKQYGFGGDNRLKAKAGRSFRKLWILTIGILLAAAWFGLQMGERRAELPKDADFDVYLERAMAARKIGDWQLALKNLKQAHALRPAHADANLMLAPLMMKIEGQTVLSKRILHESLAIDHSPEFVAQAKAGLGLAALIDEDYNEASRYLNEALRADRNNFAALFNLGMVFYQTGQFDEASHHFQKAMVEAPNDAVTLLMLARNEARASQEQKAPARLDQAAEYLNRHIEKFHDYRQEAYLLAAWVDLHRGDKRGAFSNIGHMLESDPYLTEEHLRDPLLFSEPLSWQASLSDCVQVYDGLENTPRLKAFLALCQSKSGQRSEASRMINDAVSASPEDGLIQALNGYVLHTQGREDEARGAIRLASRDESLRLPLILGGRFCARRQDTECANENWKRLLPMTPPSLMAIAGLAGQAVQGGNWEEARTLVESGLELSPRYIPLMILNDTFNRP